MHTHIFVLFGVWKEGLLRLSVQDFFSFERPFVWEYQKGGDKLVAFTAR